jgi:Zn-dependent protease
MPETLPLLIACRAMILLVAFPLHEFSHAIVANAFGDDTPRRDGRLTLNPGVHIELFGAIILMLTGFGWARPVQIDPYKLNKKHRSATMWVSLAGPVSNLLLALIMCIPFRLGIAYYLSGHSQAFLSAGLDFLDQFIWINIILMFFNLIPVFPLDGEKVLDFLLPPSGRDILARIRPYSSLMLMAMLIILPRTGFDLIGKIIVPFAETVFSLITGV